MVFVKHLFGAKQISLAHAMTIAKSRIIGPTCYGLGINTLLARIFTKGIAGSGRLHCVDNGILANGRIGPGKFLNTFSDRLAIVPRNSSVRRVLK